MSGGVVAQSILCADDPAPVDWINKDSPSPVILLCEHAGQAIPARLGRMGLSEDAMNSHAGWDIGAERLARLIAARLQAPLIVQRYSRLVVDCNRPPGSQGSIPTQIDQVDIPANVGMTAEDHNQRRQAIFDPMNDAITAGFDACPRRAAFSVHSFTPTYRGQARPWHAGFLSRRDQTTAQAMIDHIAQADPALTLSLNEPYQIDDASDWFIPRHAEARGVAHSLIEVRNDQLLDDASTARWATLLSDAISHVLESLT